MGRNAHRYYRSQIAKRLLRSVVGSHGLAFFVTIILLVTLDWFAAASWQVQNEVLSALGWGRYTAVFGIVPFATAVAILYLLARGAPSQQRPRVVEYKHPRQVPVLVMFLSPPPQDSRQIDQIASGEKEANLTDKDILGSLGSWRMPVEGIAYHADTTRTGQTHRHLKRVVVIPSRDRERDEKQGSGTHRYVNTFRRFVSNLAEQDPRMSSFKVHSLDQLIDESSPEELPAYGYALGVDYESPLAIEEAVNVAYEACYRLGIPDHEILVDVTSGQKPASVAGAVVALGVNRRIQYVSTHNYEVRVYDVTFDE